MKTIRQERKEGADDWNDVPDETSPWRMRPGYEYRIMLEPAAPKWPHTTMKQDEILSAWYSGSNVVGHVAETLAMYRVANAAIACACESGALVPADKVRKIEAKAQAEGLREGVQQEYERNRLLVSMGRISGAPYSESQMEIARMQHAACSATRGLTK